MNDSASSAARAGEQWLAVVNLGSGNETGRRSSMEPSLLRRTRVRGNIILSGENKGVVLNAVNLVLLSMNDPVEKRI